MKKILFLFAALVSAASAMAQTYQLGDKTSLENLSNEKIYAIHSTNNEGYWCYNSTINGNYVGIVGVVTNGSGVVGNAAANTAYHAAFNAADVNNQWKITKEEEQYYLYNVGAEKYVTRSGRDYQFTATKTALDAIYTNTDGSYAIHAGGDFSAGSTNFACIVTNTTPQAVRNWNSTDHGSKLEFIEIEDAEAVVRVDVTYEYVVDGHKVSYTTTKQQKVGETPAEPSETYAFATVSSNASELTVASDGSTVVTVNITQNLPFQVWDGESFPAPTGLLHVHSNQARFLYAEVDQNWENGLLWDTTDEIYRGDFDEDGRFYDWWMEGNVVEGFKLANYVGYVNITAGNQATINETEGTTFDLRPTTAGVGGRNFKNGFCLAIAGTNNFLNAQTKIQAGNRTTGVKTWTSADAGSTFEFEYVYDFNISDAGYATLFYHSPLQLPEGVTGYSVVLSAEGDRLIATELENGFVPSATGVILAGNAGDYTATVTTAHGNAAIENNVLSGRYVNGSDGINENTYVLAVDTDGAHFAKFTGSQLGEFKAYYQAPAASASNLRISFEELTSIISAAQQNGGQAIFDLQGRRVVNAQNGLYIVNGKKVIR